MTYFHIHSLSLSQHPNNIIGLGLFLLSVRKNGQTDSELKRYTDSMQESSISFVFVMMDFISGV